MGVRRVRVVAAVVRLTSTEPSNRISVVVPVYNEERIVRTALEKVIEQLGDGDELIVVDGNSSDRTLMEVERLKDSRVHTVRSLTAGRAGQMNAGAAIASNPLLLFLHIDSALPRSAIADIRRVCVEPCWGRFDVTLDNPAFAYRVISWFINWRSSLSSIATGDQAIFVNRSLFDRVKGFADQPLMEDVEMSKQLKTHGKPVRIRDRVVTSARKWEQGGIVKTVWLMWVLRAKYARGESPAKLHAMYYR